MCDACVYVYVSGMYLQVLSSSAHHLRQRFHTFVLQTDLTGFYSDQELITIFSSHIIEIGVLELAVMDNFLVAVPNVILSFVFLALRSQLYAVATLAAGGTLLWKANTARTGSKQNSSEKKKKKKTNHVNYRDSIRDLNDEFSTNLSARREIHAYNAVDESKCRYNTFAMTHFISDRARTFKAFMMKQMIMSGFEAFLLMSLISLSLILWEGGISYDELVSLNYMTNLMLKPLMQFGKFSQELLRRFPALKPLKKHFLWK